MKDGTEPMTPGEDARVNAALDQLAAALSEIAGEEIGRPVVVLARAVESEGLLAFQAGIEFQHVPLLLLRGAVAILGSAPDLSRFRPPESST